MLQNQVKDAAARLVTGIHRAVFTASGGRVGGRVMRMPVVMLTTTGRKSGKRRTTMLTSPVQEGDTVVLVASYGGDDRHPTWYLNLRDNPDVEVTMGGHHRHMRARVATPEEKDAVRAIARNRGGSSSVPNQSASKSAVSNRASEAVSSPSRCLRHRAAGTSSLATSATTSAPRRRIGS